MTKTYRAVVGIDPSISSSGVAVHQPERSVARTRVLVVPTREQGQDHFNRMERMHFGANGVIAKVPYNSLVLYEGPAFGAKGASFHDLAGFWWKLYELLATGWSDVIVVPPTTLKKFATGKGTAKKEEVMLAAVRRWPDLNITGNDTADAAVLMQMGRVLTGTADFEMPKTHMEALAGLQLSEGLKS